VASVSLLSAEQLGRLRHQALAHFAEQLQARVAALQGEMQAIQAAANEETKSSAGDKYETGRAQAHLELMKLQSTLAATQEQAALLGPMLTQAPATAIGRGALVLLSDGNAYLLAGNLGKVALEVEGLPIPLTSLSPGSPLGLAMQGLAAGHTLKFRDNTWQIIALA
jgi:hypothetical protein